MAEYRLDQIAIYDPIDNTQLYAVFMPKDFITATLKEQIITRTKGFENFDFTIPLSDKRCKEIKNERLLTVGGRRYIIKRIIKEKSDSKIMTVECEALWYELNGFAPFEKVWWTGNTSVVMARALQDTGWTVGEVTVSRSHNFLAKENSSPLYMLRYIAKLLDAELTFDTMNKRVNMLERAGSDRGVVISYTSNLKGITRIDDTTNLITRVYMYGAEGVTIADINGGIPYLEDYSWMDAEGLERKVISEVVTDERFSVLESMKEYMLDRLATYSHPITSYEVQEYVIQTMLGIGDSVLISDADLNKNDTHRVIEREIDLIQPQQSTYVLDFAIDDLSENEEDDYVELLDDSSVADVEEDLNEHVSNLVVHITNAERIRWNEAANTAENIQLDFDALKQQVDNLTTVVNGQTSQIQDLETRVTALENA